MIDTDKALEQIAQQTLKTAIKEECQTQELKHHALGIAIARYCEWYGEDILKIFASALEDSNYHAQANIVREWIGED